MLPMPVLSVLDQSLDSSGRYRRAILETLELAGRARPGYHRYWLAEHHSSGGLPGPRPRS
jgi:alkanesulfonate monooxygenase SsuD/methylene tetrahydromethanopterin reductase-like flavin-dependent oxidoreductase (luciferase family)